MASQSNGTKDFARNVHFFALAIPVAMTRAVAKSAQFTKSTIMATEQVATGGDFILSGTRKAQPLIKPRYRVFENSYDPAAVVNIRGPAHLIEWDTAPHSTVKRSRSQVRAGKKRKKLGPGVFGPVLSGPVPARAGLAKTHPGTKGKHPFERGANAAAPEVVSIMTRAFATQMVKSWR